MMNSGMMNTAGAYGAGKAGAPFDLMTFIRRPAVILRIVAILFSIIVFGCLASEGYMEDRCIMNDSNACGFGVFVGVIGFLGSVGLLVLEWRFEQISSVKIRRRAVLGDLGFTAAWAFFYFIGFCYMANQWSKTEEDATVADYGETNAQAAVAFSFFSIPVWLALAYLTYLRYQQGVANAFNPGFESDAAGGMPRGGYSSYPGAPDDHYQDAPFASPGQNQGFQSPAY